MTLSFSTGPRLLWEPLKTFQRTYWQSCIDRRCCGNDPVIFFRPHLCIASMHGIPGRTDRVVFRYLVWFDRQYWE